MSLPRAIVSKDGALWKASDWISSRKLTVERFRLGISTPTVSHPGTGAWIRMASALRLRARSSVRLVNRPTRTPWAGRISNSVITGPGVTRTSSP